MSDSRVIKETHSLVNAGYEVAVIGLHEGTLPLSEVIDSVAIHRIALATRGWFKWKPMQLIKYIEFLFRAVSRSKNYDIIHCNDLSALPVGVIVKIVFSKKVKIVYDAHECETEVQGLHGAWKIIVKIAERILIGRADAVITVSDAIADKYAKDYSITKPSLVLNCPQSERIASHDIFRRKFGISKETNIFLYQGGFGYGRGIEIIIDAFVVSQGKGNQAVVFMGDGPLSPQVLAAAENYPNIFFQDAVPYKDLLAHTSSADFGILFYENTCLNHYYCSPNKLFEYLMAGLPIVASNLFEVKKIVEGNKLGVVSRTIDANGLKDAIDKLMGLDINYTKRQVYEARKTYCWAYQEDILLGVYRSLLG